MSGRRWDRIRAHEVVSRISGRFRGPRELGIGAWAIAGAGLGGSLAWATHAVDPFVVVLSAGAAGAACGYAGGARGACTLRLLLAVLNVAVGVSAGGAVGVAMALFGASLGGLTLVSARRAARARALQTPLRVSVRRADGRKVRVAVPAGASARYAARRAARALDDPFDPRACVLARAGAALLPERSLLAGGVRDGDTLELVDAPPQLRHRAGRPEGA